MFNSSYTFNIMTKIRHFSFDVIIGQFAVRVQLNKVPSYHSIIYLSLSQ